VIKRNEISKEETVVIELIGISKEDVAHRAHELYVQRGSAPGKDVADWVRAERELSSEIVLGPVKKKAALVGHT
jgi:hypothetical protein